MTINDLIATSSVHAFHSGVQSGKALEQERIIKVLEGHEGTYLREEAMYCCDGVFDHAIELIKGEQK